MSSSLIKNYKKSGWNIELARFRINYPESLQYTYFLSVWHYERLHAEGITTNPDKAQKEFSDWVIAIEKITPKK